MIFIVILFILSLLTLNELKQFKKIPSYVYWGIVFVLIVLAGFRGGVGADDLVYEGEFNKITSSTGIGEINFEPGFAFLMIVFRSLNLPFEMFCLLISIVSILCKGIAFSKGYSEKKNAMLFGYYLLFYFNVEFAQIRLGMSMGLCLLAMIFLFGENKNSVLFYLFVILACLIQITAIVFLPVYFIVNCKFRKIILGSLMIILVLMAFCDLHGILYWLNESILHSDYLYVKIVEYLDSLPLLNASLLIRIVTFVFCAGTIFYAQKEYTEFQKVHLILYLFGIGVYFGLRQVAILSIRMASLFRIFEIPLLINVQNNCKLINNKVIKIAAYSFLMMIVAYYVMSFFADMSANQLIWYYPKIL